MLFPIVLPHNRIRLLSCWIRSADCFLFHGSSSMGILISSGANYLSLEASRKIRGLFPLFVGRTSAIVPSVPHVDKAGESQPI